MKTDLLDIMIAVVEGRLAEQPVEWSDKKAFASDGLGRLPGKL
jgi:hypothetical protein